MVLQAQGRQSEGSPSAEYETENEVGRHSPGGPRSQQGEERPKAPPESPGLGDLYRNDTAHVTCRGLVLSFKAVFANLWVATPLG